MHSTLQVRYAQTEDGRSITVIYDGKSYDATDQHPNFDEIFEEAMADDPAVIDLFDIADTIARRTPLSERFSIAANRLYFDGDELSGALADGIMHLIHEDEDPRVLVAFAERLMTNPEPDSRDQLYSFLAGQKFTMTEEGKLIMYKGVIFKGDLTEDGHRIYYSHNAGSAFVNGVHVQGQIPQSVGDVVEMPRHEVQHDPTNACSVGLHAATFGFAKNFTGASGPVLELEVDPRDVVSVPTHERSKVRVSRYRVLGIREVEHTTSVRREEPRPPKKDKKAKHPSEAVFEDLKVGAKARKLGIVKFAERHHMVYGGGDKFDRKSYTISR